MVWGGGATIFLFSSLGNSHLFLKVLLVLRTHGDWLFLAFLKGHALLSGL